MSENGDLQALAQAIAGIYDGFTERIRALGSKANGSKRSSRLGESLAHWMGGSHVTTVREQLCDTFLEDVQAQIALLTAALADASPQEAQAAAAQAAEIMLAPQPARSDATTALMKRAMIGQAEPLLPYLAPETLSALRDRLAAAYDKRDILPVEKQMLKKMDKLLKSGGD